MAKQREDGEDRLEALAREIYLCAIVNSTGRTPQSLAEKAFADAREFFAVADARREQKRP